MKIFYITAQQVEHCATVRSVLALRRRAIVFFCCCLQLLADLGLPEDAAADLRNNVNEKKLQNEINISPLFFFGSHQEVTTLASFLPPYRLLQSSFSSA